MLVAFISNTKNNRDEVQGTMNVCACVSLIVSK